MRPHKRASYIVECRQATERGAQLCPGPRARSSSACLYAPAANIGFQIHCPSRAFLVRGRDTALMQGADAQDRAVRRTTPSGAPTRRRCGCKGNPRRARLREKGGWGSSEDETTEDGAPCGTT